MPSAARSPPSLKFIAPMRTLRAALASVAPLVGLLSSYSDPHLLYELAEIAVRHPRNGCTTSAETTVRMRPFCVFAVRRNACSFSPVLHTSPRPAATFEAPAESAGGISPPAAHRTGRTPLEVPGSWRPCSRARLRTDLTSSSHTRWLAHFGCPGHPAPLAPLALPSFPAVGSGEAAEEPLPPPALPNCPCSFPASSSHREYLCWR